MAKPQSKSPSKAPIDKKLSLADLWDETDPTEAQNTLSDGEQEVRLNSFTLKEDPKKGIACICEYEAIEGDDEGKTIRQMYKLRDADGGKGPGMAYLMRDLALLGYEKIEGSKLKKILAEISEEQPMVVVNVKTNGQYKNAYLQGTVENGTEADADGSGDNADVELEVGDRVTFEVDGDDKVGEIKKINEKKGVATVEDDDGDEHKIDLDDLTKEDEAEPAEPEEEAVEIEEGDTVTFDDEEGDEVEGEVESINVKKNTASIKVGKKLHKNIDLSECKKVGAEPEASGWEPAVGDDVKWTDTDGDDHTGEIKKINAKKGIATIEDSDGDEHKIELSELEED